MTEGLHYGVQLVERRVNKFSGFSAGDAVLSAENDRREDLAAETEKALDFLGRFSPGKKMRKPRIQEFFVTPLRRSDLCQAYRLRRSDESLIERQDTVTGCRPPEVERIGKIDAVVHLIQSQRDQPGILEQDVGKPA